MADDPTPTDPPAGGEADSGPLPLPLPPTPQPGSAPSAPRRKRRLRLWLWAIAVALLLAIGLAGLGQLMIVYPQQPGPGRGEVIQIVVAPDSTLRSVAAELARRGALEDSQLFELYARMRSADGKLRTGPTLVRDSMTPLQLLSRLAKGYGQVPLRIVLPEGLSRHEVADRLARWRVCSAQAFLAASEDVALLQELGVPGTSAEGWLFPDTYQFMDDSSPRDVLTRLVKQSHRRFGPLLGDSDGGLGAQPRELGWGAQEIVTLASIVEEEAAVPGERAVIAGVFYNRLLDPEFRPKRLQADPSVAYGCRVMPELASCQGFDGRRITRRMLADAENPYNTYRHEGLPPGPISNPGLGALRAALRPATHDYLYFVASGGGRHVFSATLEDHNRAVARHRNR